jgi:hypothetical protein
MACLNILPVWYGRREFVALTDRRTTCNTTMVEDCELQIDPEKYFSLVGYKIGVSVWLTVIPT